MENIVSLVYQNDIAHLPHVPGRWYRTGTSIPTFQFYQDILDANGNESRQSMPVVSVATNSVRLSKTTPGYYYVVEDNIIYNLSGDTWTAITTGYASQPAATIYSPDGVRSDVTDVIDNNGLLKNGSVVVRDINRVVRAILSVDESGNLCVMPSLGGGITLYDNKGGFVTIKDGKITYSDIVSDIVVGTVDPAISRAISENSTGIQALNNLIQALNTKLVGNDQSMKSFRESLAVIQKSISADMSGLRNSLSGSSQAVARVVTTLTDCMNKVSNLENSDSNQNELIQKLLASGSESSAAYGIKYVSSYRSKGLSDNDIIDAALKDLNDYETLVFESDETYNLTRPIYLTLVGDNEYADRVGNTFIGNNCTIKIADTSSWNASDPLIVLSDTEPVNESNKMKVHPDRSSVVREYGNGLSHCRISQFRFESVSKVPALKVLTQTGSLYSDHCIIDNCEFKGGYGMYFCGRDSEVCFNQFTNCVRGIYDDGGSRSYHHDNYFFTTTESAIYANQCYNGLISHNIFHKCSGDAITLNGSQPRGRTDEKTVRMSVINNFIRGSASTGTVSATENGIASYGYEDLVIMGNIIHDMATCANNTEKKDSDEIHGSGILITGGYLSNTSCRISQRVSIADNIIYGCMRSGIRVRYSSSVNINNNNITGREIYPDKHAYLIAGITVDSSTRVTVTNNHIEGYSLDMTDDSFEGVRVSSKGTVDVLVSNNQYNSGCVFPDVIRASNYYTIDSSGNRVYPYPDEVSTLYFISTTAFAVNLVKGSEYVIWIPGSKSDGSGSFEKFLYKSKYYNFCDTYGNLCPLLPVGDGGEFTKFIYTDAGFQQCNIFSNTKRSSEDNSALILSPASISSKLTLIGNKFDEDTMYLISVPDSDSVGSEPFTKISCNSVTYNVIDALGNPSEITPESEVDVISCSYKGDSFIQLQHLEVPKNMANKYNQLIYEILPNITIPLAKGMKFSIWIPYVESGGYSYIRCNNTDYRTTTKDGVYVKVSGDEGGSYIEFIYSSGQFRLIN